MKRPQRERFSFRFPFRQVEPAKVVGKIVRDIEPRTSHSNGAGTLAGKRHSFADANRVLGRPGDVASVIGVGANSEIEEAGHQSHTVPRPAAPPPFGLLEDKLEPSVRPSGLQASFRNCAMRNPGRYFTLLTG